MRGALSWHRLVDDMKLVVDFPLASQAVSEAPKVSTPM